MTGQSQKSPKTRLPAVRPATEADMGILHQAVTVAIRYAEASQRYWNVHQKARDTLLELEATGLRSDDPAFLRLGGYWLRGGGILMHALFFGASSIADRAESKWMSNAGPDALRQRLPIAVSVATVTDGQTCTAVVYQSLNHYQDSDFTENASLKEHFTKMEQTGTALTRAMQRGAWADAMAAHRVARNELTQAIQEWLVPTSKPRRACTDCMRVGA